MNKKKLRKQGIKKHKNGSTQCYIVGFDSSLGFDYSCILYGRLNKIKNEFLVCKEVYIR